MLVTKRIAEFIEEAGKRAYPNEACGLIYAKGKKEIPVECKNVSDNPTNNFLIDPKDQLEVMKLGEIVGGWHTHCNTTNEASDADKQGCENTGVTWYIGAVCKENEELVFKGVNAIAPTGFMMPLVRRPYAYGIFDCYTLLRDYYKINFNIDLGDWGRGESPWDESPNYFEDKAKEIGFYRVGDDFQKGDLLLIQAGTEGKPDHCAIYVGDDKILHHMRDRLSRHDVYGGSFWQMRTISHWRHKDVD